MTATVYSSTEWVDGIGAPEEIPAEFARVLDDIFPDSPPESAVADLACWILGYKDEWGAVRHARAKDIPRICRIMRTGVRYHDLDWWKPDKTDDLFTSPKLGSWHTNPDGSPGGFVEATAKVAATATLAPTARVLDSAQVSEYACVDRGATIRQWAHVTGHANVYGIACVEESARVQDWAHVYGSARVGGDTVVCDFAHVCGSTVLVGRSKISGDALVHTDYPITRYDVVASFRNLRDRSDPRPLRPR